MPQLTAHVYEPRAALLASASEPCPLYEERVAAIRRLHSCCSAAVVRASEPPAASGLWLVIGSRAIGSERAGAAPVRHISRQCAVSCAARLAGVTWVPARQVRAAAADGAAGHGSLTMGPQVYAVGRCKTHNTVFYWLWYK